MRSFIAIALYLSAVSTSTLAGRLDRIYGRSFAENDLIVDPDQYGEINKFFELLDQKAGNTNWRVNKEFFEAVLTGNEPAVRNFIRNGVNVNVQAPNGFSALHMVAWKLKGNTKIGEILLHYGADINSKTEFDWTPLHTACFNGNKPVVELLIEKGARVNQKTNEGWVPLHCCAYKGHKDIMLILLDKGADVNVPNFRGNTALHVAATENREKIVEELIKRGINLDQKSTDGWTALAASAWHGHYKIVRLLAENGAKIDITNKEGNLPICIATERGNRKVVEVINEIVANQNAEPNQIASNDNVAVKQACQTYSQLRESQYIPPKHERRQYPWMAALFYSSGNNKLKSRCGGTIISKNFILTAAHCVQPGHSPISIQVGKSTNPTGDDHAQPMFLSIEEIVRHPTFSMTTFKNDIALIRISGEIEFNENIQPACLHTDTRDPQPDAQLIVTGWSTATQQSDDSSELVKKYLSPMQRSLCSQIYSQHSESAQDPLFNNGFSKGQICALDYNGRNDSCVGDGGGPLQMFRNESSVAIVIGIVSFGWSPCGSAFPSIYTRVAHYLDWIESIVWPNLANSHLPETFIRHNGMPFQMNRLF